MSADPQRAPEEVRQAILNALRADDFSIYSDGRRWLEQLGFQPNAMVKQDVVDYLAEDCALYLLVGADIKGIKYQCCIGYEDGLVVHVKMVPRDIDDRYHVVLGFHRHNTGGSPLPS